jgi:spheroidene monooxygenase
MAVSGVVVVLLVDFLRAHQGWGWMRLVQGAAAFKDTPGLLFTKVMGSGHEGGFVLRPSATHQGLVCMFENAEQADQFIDSAAVKAYAERAKSIFVSALAVTSARGSWDGRAWDATPPERLGKYLDMDTQAAGMAALTRASIRPAKAVAFWRYAPAAQDDLKNAPGCELAMGLGEAPLVRQCTFSVCGKTRLRWWTMRTLAPTSKRLLRLTKTIFSPNPCSCVCVYCGVKDSGRG